MEEKKAEIPSSIWPVFGYKFPFSSIFSISNRSAILKILLNRTKSNAGFTLIEILIVVAIIGVLAAGFITIIDPAGQLKASRDGKRKSDIRKIQSALELYRADCGAYPSSLGASLISSCTGSTITYLSSVPQDPRTNAAYTYSSPSPYSTYSLSACLEKTSDPEGSGNCTVSQGVSGIYFTGTNP